MSWVPKWLTRDRAPLDPGPIPERKRSATGDHDTERAKRQRRAQQPPELPHPPPPPTRPSPGPRPSPRGVFNVNLEDWVPKPPPGLTVLDGEKPNYVVLDVEIRDQIWKVMNLIERFSKTYFAFEGVGDAGVYEAVTSMGPETKNMIGRIAAGGPGGLEGWKELFTRPYLRQALVCGMIGYVVVEQVFMHPFFGGDAKRAEYIAKKYRNGDGFHRNREFSEVIRQDMPHTYTSPSYTQLPTKFKDHVKEIALRTYEHLTPIVGLSPGLYERKIEPVRDLSYILTLAGLLSLAMRLDGNTVYHFPAPYKDLRYDNQIMECFNEGDMRAHHPRNRPTPWPEHISPAEIKRAQLDEPLVKICLMAGCTAYRPGGWQDEDGEYVQEKGKTVKDMGFRSRVLTHQWVFCRWGRKRRFDGSDDRDVHGIEWREPGFVEFGDFVAVAEKEKAGGSRTRGRSGGGSGKGKQRAR